MDRAFAELGIGGVRHLAGGLEDGTQGAFGGQGKAIVGGFAIDEKAAAFGIEVGGLGTCRVALFAAHKQQSNSKSLCAQGFCRCDLAGDNALRIRDSAAVHKVLILAEGDIGRDSVHVGGEDQIGRLPGHARVDVPARAASRALRRLSHGSLFDCPAALGKEMSQKITHCAFVVGGGLDFTQLTGEPDGIKRRGIFAVIEAELC